MHLYLHFRCVEVMLLVVIPTQGIVNFRNPTGEVLPVAKDLTESRNILLSLTLMDVNACSLVMSSVDACWAKICK